MSFLTIKGMQYFSKLMITPDLKKKKNLQSQDTLLKLNNLPKLTHSHSIRKIKIKICFTRSVDRKIYIVALQFKSDKIFPSPLKMCRR